MVEIIAESKQRFKSLCAAYNIPAKKAKFISVKDRLKAEGRTVATCHDQMIVVGRPTNRLFSPGAIE